MVWKLAKDHVEHGNKIHPNTRNNKTEIIDETSFVKPGNKMTKTVKPSE